MQLVLAGRHMIVAKAEFLLLPDARLARPVLSMQARSDFTLLRRMASCDGENNGRGDTDQLPSTTSILDLSLFIQHFTLPRPILAERR